MIVHAIFKVPAPPVSICSVTHTCGTTTGRLTRGLIGNDRLSDISATTLTGCLWPVSDARRAERNVRNRGIAAVGSVKVNDRTGRSRFLHRRHFNVIEQCPTGRIPVRSADCLGPSPIAFFAVTPCTAVEPLPLTTSCKVDFRYGPIMCILVTAYRRPTNGRFEQLRALGSARAQPTGSIPWTSETLRQISATKTSRRPRNGTGGDIPTAGRTCRESKLSVIAVRGAPI